MRLGVLDVGSNTVHFLVVDAHQGGRPLPVFSHKAELHLGDNLEEGNRLSRSCALRLRGFVGEALQIAEDKGVEELLAFATSAVRDAVNSDDVLASIKSETGVDIAVLPGPEEARLTFLAARRWFGWSSGKVLMLDIGGGSLEIAVGIDEVPDVAVSLPLGAGRLTRDWLTGDPPTSEQTRQLRKYVRAGIARRAGEVTRMGEPDRAVATSKTFKQLARIAGAAPSDDGPYVRRVVSHADVTELAKRLAAMSWAERAELPGVSRGRAPQLAACALVADAAMDLFGLAELEICPWALREGVILRRLDTLSACWKRRAGSGRGGAGSVRQHPHVLAGGARRGGTSGPGPGPDRRHGAAQPARPWLPVIRASGTLADVARCCRRRQLSGTLLALLAGLAGAGPAGRPLGTALPGGRGRGHPARGERGGN